MSQDPIGYDGGDWNIYTFVGNNPRNLSNSTGLAVDTAASYIPAISIIGGGAAIGCGLQATLSFGAAFIGDGNYEVIGFTKAPGSNCAVLPILAAKPQPINTSGTKTGDHTPGGDCWFRNLKVQAAKTVVAALGKCTAGMSAWQLGIRESAWQAEAIARASRDEVCWSGGDAGHQRAQAAAWKNLGTCQSLLAALP